MVEVCFGLFHRLHIRATFEVLSPHLFGGSEEGSEEGSKEEREEEEKEHESEATKEEEDEGSGDDGSGGVDVAFNQFVQRRRAT